MRVYVCVCVERVCIVVVMLNNINKGIGFEIARTLSFAGASVAITSRNADEVQTKAKSISNETGGQVIGLRADASSESDCEQVFTFTRVCDERHCSMLSTA